MNKIKLNKMEGLAGVPEAVLPVLQWQLELSPKWLVSGKA